MYFTFKSGNKILVITDIGITKGSALHIEKNKHFDEISGFRLIFLNLQNLLKTTDDDQVLFKGHRSICLNRLLNIPQNTAWY